MYIDINVGYGISADMLLDANLCTEAELTDFIYKNFHLMELHEETINSFGDECGPSLLVGRTVEGGVGIPSFDGKELAIAFQKRFSSQEEMNIKDEALRVCRTLLAYSGDTTTFKVLNRIIQLIIEGEMTYTSTPGNS